MNRLLNLSFVIWCLVAGAAVGFERPVINLRSPTSIENGVLVTYSNHANITVLGEIKPPVGNSVTVRIYHMLEDGKMLRMAGANTPIRDGKFAMSIDPPSGGWFPGLMRVEITLGGMPQVKSSVHVTVAPPEGPIRAAGWKPPDDSGITVDLAKSRGTTVVVPADKLFCIRGQFECEGIESKFEGPNVWGSIIKEPVDGKGKLTYQSGICLSLRESEGKPAFGYELQIQPTKSGIFGVRITPQMGMWADELEREKPDFMLEVSEPVK